MKLKKTLLTELRGSERITTQSSGAKKKKFILETKDDFEEMKSHLESNKFYFINSHICCEYESENGNKTKIIYPFLSYNDEEFRYGTELKEDEALKRLTKEFNSDKIDFEKLSTAIWQEITNKKLKKTKEVLDILEESLSEQKKNLDSQKVQRISNQKSKQVSR